MSLAPVPRARLQASLACVVTLALWWWRRGQLPAAVAGLAAAFALLAWVSPARYAPIQRALDQGVRLILAAFTWVVLGTVWLLVFTPLRGFRTLTGRDALACSFDPKATSYLQTPRPPGRFDRQF